MFTTSDCSDWEVRDYRFVRYEFDVALLIVYLGVLRLVSRHRVVACLLDVVSSVYLLWATYTRQFYLHNTSVGQWAKDLCSAIVSDKELIYNYLAVSVVSWVASSFLEWNSVVHFKKLYSTRLWRCLRWSGLSRSRSLVLTLAVTCTVNSLVLTLVLWSTVHHSFENVTQDRSILTFNTIAALMRLLRQFVEGLTFIAGIVTKDFRWRNSREEKLMGRIAFSSFMLLIHSSVLTYTFCNTRVWSFDQLIVFSALLVDVGFQIVVCLWAAANSCCYATAKEYIKNLTFHRFRSTVRGSLHFTFTTVCTLCSFAVSTVTVVGLRLKSILHFCEVTVQTLLMFVFGAIRLACFCVGLVLTAFVEAWRNYVLHWQIDVDFDDPAIELVEPVQIQLVYQETQGHAEDTPREVVFPSYSVRDQYSYDSHYSHCNALANEILKSRHTCTTQRKHSLSVVLSSSSTLSASSHSTAPSTHEPLSWQEERDSTCHSCLCTFECSTQPQTAPPYFPSHASPPQPLPVQQREALIAPSLPNTKLGGQQSELVAR